MAIVWKIEEIEWINKIGSDEQVADNIKYSCKAIQDSHTTVVYGNVNLVSENYENISDSDYTTLKNETGVVEYEHEETVNTENIKTHTGTIYRTTSGSYIAYNDLTESQVITWVKAKLGNTKVSELEATVEALLAEDVATGNTFKHTSSLPW